MWTQHKLSDEVVNLRCIGEADVGDAYLGWLHDEEVVRFLEVRHTQPHSGEDIKSFVRSMIGSSVDLLMGIFVGGGKHVGNIKLTVVSKISQRAEIGILIGDKSCWGQGIATRAIRLLTEYAVCHLGMRKITAGCYAPNLGSQKAFLKAGYLAEGVLKDHWEFEGGRVDELLFGYSAAVDSGTVRTLGTMPEMLVFIGGGELMLDAIEMARRRGFGARAILAPRHAAEMLPDGRTMVEALAVAGVDYAVVVSPDEIIGHDLLRLNMGRKMALCFGPAWVFPNALLAKFECGMFNYNGIPVPEYLGGAHFTWQILNGDRQSGCFIQRVTADLDRGGIVFHRFQDIPNTARVPADYFYWNRKFGRTFLEDYFDSLARGSLPVETSFESVAGRRLYFPRLNTRENGWIDWDWSGEAILSFCNAFDAPYVGASTYYEGRWVHLRGARMITGASVRRFHPYCSGLIVAVGHGDASIATSAGLLLIERIVCANSGVPISVVQGHRFHTDSERLRAARSFRPYY